MVRIGSGEAPLAQRARDVWVDGLVRQYTSLHPEAHSQRKSQHIREATQLSKIIMEVVRQLSAITDQASILHASVIKSAPTELPLWKASAMNSSDWASRLMQCRQCLLGTLHRPCRHLPIRLRQDCRGVLVA